MHCLEFGFWANYSENHLAELFGLYFFFSLFTLLCVGCRTKWTIDKELFVSLFRSLTKKKGFRLNFAPPWKRLSKVINFKLKVFERQLVYHLWSIYVFHQIDWKLLLKNHNSCQWELTTEWWALRAIERLSTNKNLFGFHVRLIKKFHSETFILTWFMYT